MLRRYWLMAVCGAALVTTAACGKKDRGAETGAVTPPPTATTAAPAAEAVRVSDIKLGSTVDAQKRVTKETDTFKPTETIYASVTTTGTAPSSTIAARWTFGSKGQLVKEDSRSIAPNGTETTEFHISKPSGFPKGNYKVEIMLNGTTAQTKDFKVGS